MLSSPSSAWPAGVALTQRYRDDRTGLIVHFPAGWTLDSEAPGFAIVNFPPRKRPAQVEVPIDGAEIGILGPPGDEKSVMEWMRSDRINETLGYNITQFDLVTKHFGAIETTVARDEPTVIPRGTLLLCFFEIGGRPIKVSLIYRGRRRAAYFESIFRSMIENLERDPQR